MQNSNEHIDYDLLTKHLMGEASAVEEIQIKQWLAANPKNEGVLNELRKVLDLVEENNDSSQVNTDAAWQKMQKKINASASTKVVELDTQTNRSTRFRRLGIAAAIIGILTMLAVVFNTSTGVGSEMIALSNGAEILSDTLPDGTIITLNKNSELRYAKSLSGKTRTVLLSGEAFFDVAKDASRPFIINAGDIDVTVLGTSFNVKAYAKENIEVAVRTGKVKVDDRTTADPLVLLPGQKAAYNRATKKLEEVASKKSDEEFWHLRKLVFYNTSLAEVIKILNERFGASIELVNKEAAQCRFTSTFNDDPLQDILAVLTATFDLELTETDGKQLLKGTACNVATP